MATAGWFTGPSGPPRRADAEVIWSTVDALIGEALTAADGHIVAGVGVGSAGPIDVTEGTVSPINIAAWQGFPIVQRVAQAPGCRCGWPATWYAWRWVSAGGAPVGVRGSCSAWWCPPASVVVWCSTVHRMSVAPVTPGTSVTSWSNPMGRCVPAVVAAAWRRWPPARIWRSGRMNTDGTRRRTPTPRRWPRPPPAATRWRCAHFAVAPMRSPRPIASAAAVCDLDLVVLGGGVAQAGEVLFGPLRERLAHYARLSFLRGLRVVPAALGGDAGLVGAAALVADMLRPHRAARPRGRWSCRCRCATEPFWLIGGPSATLIQFHRRPSATEKSVEGPGNARRPTQEDEVSTADQPSVAIRAPAHLRRGVCHFRVANSRQSPVGNRTHHKEACMAKAEKATAVADIAEQFKASTATVVTEYRGLTVANLAELRRSLGDFDDLHGRQEHPGQARCLGGRNRGPRRPVRRSDRHRVHHRRAGRCCQGDQEVRQGSQAARHQGRLHGRRCAVRVARSRRSPTWSRARCCWPSWPAP